MSITYELFQDTLIYPPAPGDKGGPCRYEDCGHFDCIRMRKDALALCPTCQQPTGYGNMQHLTAHSERVFIDAADGLRVPISLYNTDTGFRTISGEHETCYQARLERERADAEAQTGVLAAATKADAEAARAEAAKTAEATANA